MHILIISEAFPPETKSASTLFFELAESLVDRGHRVSVVTRLPRHNVAEGAGITELPRKERRSGIEVNRFQTPPLARNIPLVRGLEHFILALIFFWGGIRIKDFDAVLVYSPPLPLGIAGIWLGKLRHKPVIVNIQDLYPQTVIDLGLLKSTLLINISRIMERYIYRRSDRITVHSEGNRSYVVGRGAAVDRTVVIHNWVDTGIIRPQEKDPAFLKKYGLSGNYIVSFAGVMGYAQGLEVVISAAALLQDKPDIQFILVGDGVKRAELEAQVKSLGLKNVTFIPTQPLSIYPQILYSSDICLVNLKKDLLTPAVPGKLLSILAAGKPVLASVPLSGDAPKLIDKYQCGITVEAGDSRQFANAVLKLYNDPVAGRQMGINGRRAAEEVFSRQKAISKYEDIFRQLKK